MCSVEKVPTGFPSAMAKWLILLNKAFFFQSITIFEFDDFSKSEDQSTNRLKACKNIFLLISCTRKFDFRYPIRHHYYIVTVL